MDSATLGSAVSHHPRSFRTLRRRARAPPQNADRLGSPSHTSGSPMGAKAQYRRRRRLQLLGARSDRRGSRPWLFRHQAAPRLQSVRAGAAAPPRTPRTAAQERLSASQTLPGARKQADALGQAVDALLVRRSALHSRILDRNGGWYHPGLPPAPIRWVLTRDPTGVRDPQAFLCTDINATPVEILGWFVHRWSVETTFQESRANLGVETGRQWSDLAIARMTPALLGLFSLATLWAADPKVLPSLHPRSAGARGDPERNIIVWTDHRATGQDRIIGRGLTDEAAKDLGLTPHTSVGAIIAGLDWTVASTALSLSILLAFAELVRVPSKSSTRNSPREGRTRSW